MYLLVYDTSSRGNLFFREKFYYHGTTLEVHERTGGLRKYAVLQTFRCRNSLGPVQMFHAPREMILWHSKLQ